MSDTAVALLSILAAIVPTLFYVGLVYWIDRYEKEPWWLLISAFLWGAIPSIIIAYIANTIFSIPIYAIAGDKGDAWAASLVAPPIEESIKGFALLMILFLWRDEIDSPLDGIIYGALIGIGFAMVENVFYFLGTFAESGLEAWGFNIFLRSILFGLNHALFTSMTGLGIGIARNVKNQLARLFAPVAGWSTAVFLHFLHNVSVSSGNYLCFLAFISDWGGVWLLLALMIGILWQEAKWLKEYLREEVALGTLTADQYAVACSSTNRAGYNISLLFSRPSTYFTAVRFYQAATKLAYKKHQLVSTGDERLTPLIDQLRLEVAEKSRLLQS